MVYIILFILMSARPLPILKVRKYNLNCMQL